jgi:hypothetical protein
LTQLQSQSTPGKNRLSNLIAEETTSIRAATLSVFVITLIGFYSLETLTVGFGQMQAVIGILWSIGWFLLSSGVLNWTHHTRDWTVPLAMFLGATLVAILPPLLLLGLIT